MTCKGLWCPGLDSNQHVQKDTAPSRQRVYQFRHPGWGVYFRCRITSSVAESVPECPERDPGFGARVVLQNRLVIPPGLEPGTL